MTKDISNKTIFIVEDNLVNMKLVYDILVFNNYNVIQAFSGKEALEKMQNHWEEIDLIIMDIQLPEINGFDLLKIFKGDNRFKDHPIIVLSAHAMESDMLKAKEAGCQSYITKPINVENFLKEISSYFKISSCR